MVTKEYLQKDIRDFTEDAGEDFDGVWDFLEHVFDIKESGNDENRISELSLSLMYEMDHNHGQIPKRLYRSDIPDHCKYIYIGILGIIARNAI